MNHQTTPPSYPRNVALLQRVDLEGTLLVESLRTAGAQVEIFNCGDDLLSSDRAYDFQAYVVDIDQPGVSGLHVVRIVRRRVRSATILVVGSGGLPTVDAAITSGADMYFLRPVVAMQLDIAVRALSSRTMRVLTQAPTWQLDAKARALITPHGSSVSIGKQQLKIMCAFVSRGSQAVPYRELCGHSGRSPGVEDANWLHATMYRLRRRIERASSEVLPIQSQSGVGYVFRAQLEAV